LAVRLEYCIQQLSCYSYNCYQRIWFIPRGLCCSVDRALPNGPWIKYLLQFRIGFDHVFDRREQKNNSLRRKFTRRIRYFAIKKTPCIRYARIVFDFSYCFLHFRPQSNYNRSFQTFVGRNVRRPIFIVSAGPRDTLAITRSPKSVLLTQ